MLILILIFAFYLSCFLFSLLFLGGGVVGWRGCVCFFSYPIDFLAGWQDVFTWLFRKNPSLTKFPKEVDGVGRSHFIRLRTYQNPPPRIIFDTHRKVYFQVIIFFSRCSVFFWLRKVMWTICPQTCACKENRRSFF